MIALLAVLGVLIVGTLAALVLVLVFGDEDTDVPEAAEAPEEAPRIVAGSDLDRAKRPIGWVNMRLAEMVAADEELAGLRDLNLSAYYVLPEGER